MNAGSRFLLAGSVLLSAAWTALGQQLPPRLPTPPVALSVPKPLPPPPSATDLFSQPERFHRIHPQPQPPVAVYFPGVPYFTLAPPIGVAQGYLPAPTVASGGLRLDTEPETAQVFVDRYYVGIAGDFGARGHVLDLSTGSRRIELRLAGYVTISFDVNIAPNQIVRYRGDLQALPLSPPPAPGRASTAVYVIPNCYAGDRPPIGTLPPGCDLKQMRVRR